VQALTRIHGIRAFGSQLLYEQVVGRALRRMNYRPDPDTGLLPEEYADVYGIPFSVIPFKGRTVDQAAPKDKPLNRVWAVPAREHMEIRFRIVEGYVPKTTSGLVKCDIDMGRQRPRATRSEERSNRWVNHVGTGRSQVHWNNH